MATDTKSTAIKFKSSAQDGSSKGKMKIDPSSIKRKIDSSSKHPPDSKMKSVTVTKSEVSIFNFRAKSTSADSFGVLFRPLVGVVSLYFHMGSLKFLGF